MFDSTLFHVSYKLVSWEKGTTFLPLIRGATASKHEIKFIDDDSTLIRLYRNLGSVNSSIRVVG